MQSQKDKMGHVCQDWFPKGTFKGQMKDGFYMDDTLKAQIDILLKNIRNDWDFTIIVTGGGEVRVGKSVIGMQILAYWTYMLKKLYNITCPFNVKDNIVMNGSDLIRKGNYLGQNHPYSGLIFDEAGADLQGKKILHSTTQEVLDYYRECGQYNMLNILVLPEYFDLPKGIALSRSICLINVYYKTTEEGIFQRGSFEFFSRRNKKYLYIKGKKELNYTANKCDFRGSFINFHPVNEKEYRKLKQEALTNRESRKRNKFQDQRDACWHILNKHIKMSQSQIAKKMEELIGVLTPQNTISTAISRFTDENS